MFTDLRIEFCSDSSLCAMKRVSLTVVSIDSEIQDSDRADS